MKATFCSNVGGGVFGEYQVRAWRRLGIDASLHYEIELTDYWKAKGEKFKKLQLRWRMYIKYPFKLRSRIGRAKNSEIFVAVTNPFFAPAIASKAAQGSGAKVVNLVYDLYPDALIYGADWSRGNVASRFAMATTRHAIQNCEATVYLGERLRQYSEKLYGKASRTAVIPVGTDTTVFERCLPDKRERKTIKCLYSGHMGRLHDHQTIFGALSPGLPNDLICEFASEGPGADALKKSLEPIRKKFSKQLFFTGTRNSKDWKLAMLDTDIAFVSMRNGAENVVMPSKTYSAMAAGQAILAICPPLSDLADTVLKYDCGWVVAPGDVSQLRSLLETLPDRSNEILEKRTNAYNAAHAHFSMQAIATQWAFLFNSL